MRKLIHHIFILCALLMLSACAEEKAPIQLPPSPTPLAYTLIKDILAHGLATSGAEVITVGYVFVDQEGARLVDGMSFSGATPQPISPLSEQIWLSTDIKPALKGSLQHVANTHYAIVAAQGRLEGPGQYGPQGSYRYHMTPTNLQTLTAQNTTIAELLASSPSYKGYLIRIAGALLTSKESALLTEQLSSGGIPASKARQLKLHGPLRDTALLAQLQHTANDNVRFGQVEVEGFWRDGLLTPLSIVRITAQ